MKADKLPIHCWTEPIDDATYAVNARCYVYTRGLIYGFSVFVIVDVSTAPRWQQYKWEPIGREAFLKELFGLNHGGRLPCLCAVQRGKEYGFV